MGGKRRTEGCMPDLTILIRPYNRTGLPSSIKYIIPYSVFARVLIPPHLASTIHCLWNNFIKLIEIVVYLRE